MKEKKNQWKLVMQEYNFFFQLLITCGFVMFDLEFIYFFLLFTSLSILYSNNLTRNNINRTLTINGFIVLSLKKSLSFYNCFVCKERYHTTQFLYFVLYIIFSSSSSYYSSTWIKLIFFFRFYSFNLWLFLKKYNTILDYNMVVWKNCVYYTCARSFVYLPKKICFFSYTSVWFFSLSQFFIYIENEALLLKLARWWDNIFI